MRYFNLTSHRELELFLQERVEPSPRELFIFKFDDSITEAARLALLESYQGKTNKLGVSLSMESIEKNWEQMMSYPMNHLMISLRPTRCERAFTRETPFFDRVSEFERIFAYTDTLKKLKPKLEISLEIVLTENNISQIFPLLMGSKDYGFVRYYLNPENLPLTFAKEIRAQFDNLKIYYGELYPKIAFAPHHPMKKEWNAATKNEFAGPSRVELDLCNTCNHSCLYCGLHSAELKKSNDHRHAVSHIVKDRISYDLAAGIINSLPDDEMTLIFGGAGEPLIYEQFLELLTMARDRGFSVQIYSNFSFFRKGDIEKIHNQTRGQDGSIEFIVNLSAGTAQTYVALRPNETEADFNLVLGNLYHFKDLRLKDQCGVSITIMSVTNRLNFHELVPLVMLSKEIEATKFYPKPLEIHGEKSRDLLFNESEQALLHQELFLMQFVATLMQVDLYLPTQYQDILSKRSYEKPNGLQMKELFKKYPMLFNYKPSNRKTFQKKRFPFEFSSYKSATMKTTKLILDSELPSISNLYKKIPCTVGHNYFRVYTTGEITPCCLSTYAILKLESENWWQVWSSKSMQSFRDKMVGINSEHFHLTDRDWDFCNQCSYAGRNILEYHRSIGERLKGDEDDF